MVVVSLAGFLVESAQLGRLDFFQPPCLNEKLQIAIDGCLIERTHRTAAGIQNFIYAQGSIDLLKYFLYGVPLICLPLHTGSILACIRSYCKCDCNKLDNWRRM
jgi:hypothetical protein